MAGDSDEELLARYRAGCRRSFGELHNRQAGEIRRVCIACDIAPSEFADVSQDVFEACMRAEPDYTGRAPWRTFVRTIAIRTATKRRKLRTTEPLSVELPDAAALVSVTLSLAEVAEFVDQVVADLGPAHQQVWDLKRRGESLAAAARREGIPTATLRGRLREVMEIVRRLVQARESKTG